MREVVIRPDFAAEYLAAARRHLRDNKSSASALTKLRARLTAIQRSIDRWAVAFESDGRGAATALDRIRALEAEKLDLTTQVRSLESAAKVIPLESGVSDEFLRELLDRFDEVMSLGDIQDRKALLSHVVGKIEIGERVGNSRSRDLVVHAAINRHKVGVPDGIRTRVAGVKSRCPGPG